MAIQCESKLFGIYIWKSDVTNQTNLVFCTRHKSLFVLFGLLCLKNNNALGTVEISQVVKCIRFKKSKFSQKSHALYCGKEPSASLWRRLTLSTYGMKIPLLVALVNCGIFHLKNRCRTLWVFRGLIPFCRHFRRHSHAKLIARPISFAIKLLEGIGNFELPIEVRNVPQNTAEYQMVITIMSGNFFSLFFLFFRTNFYIKETHEIRWRQIQT